MVSQKSLCIYCIYFAIFCSYFFFPLNISNFHSWSNFSYIHILCPSFIIYIPKIIIKRRFMSNLLKSLYSLFSSEEYKKINKNKAKGDFYRVFFSNWKHVGLVWGFFLIPQVAVTFVVTDSGTVTAFLKSIF